jgi:hypothetical protein
VRPEATNDDFPAAYSKVFETRNGAKQSVSLFVFDKASFEGAEFRAEKSCDSEKYSSAFHYWRALRKCFLKHTKGPF